MNTKLNSFRDVLLWVCLGGIPVLAGMLGGWGLALYLLPEAWVPWGVLTGVLAGALLDVFILRRWIERASVLPLWVWLGVYLFYSIYVFGFFMGVPVFNILLAVPAAFLTAAFLQQRGVSSAELHVRSRYINLGAALVLLAVCTTSAFLALGDPYTPANLEGMLRLGFRVTRPMLWGLVLVGGAGLLVTQSLLFEGVVRLTGFLYGLRPAGKAGA